MDNIKKLISLTQNISPENEKHLTEAFELLNGLISKRNINECFEQATDMCVVLGENCLKNDIKIIANNCLRLYFSLDPQENQYLARAYLIQAQLIKPERFDEETALDKPIGFILKAINFSKKEKRFHYLIYNSALIYYEIVRNYLRPNFYQYLCKSLSSICKTLEEVNDPNIQFRSQLMLLLIQCHIDAGHRKEVIQIVDGTATFLGKHSPYLLKDLLTTLINNSIGTLEKYLWYTKNHPAMQTFIRLCKLKIMKDKDDGSVINEAKKILSSLTGVDEVSISSSSETLNTKPDQKSTIVIPINSKKLTNEQRCSLLLELAKISLQKSIFDACHQCITKVQQMASEEMLPLLQEADFVNFELLMMESESLNEKITPATLKFRLKTIEKCKTTLLNVIRSENSRLIELGCASLWNICLPILQPSLVLKIHSHLVLVADSLEMIGCLNYKLCAQVHIEVGKGYAALEQINDAIKYLQKAILLDRKKEYTELIEHFIHKLKMQEKLYEKPLDPCDEARQLLEQVRSTLNNEIIPIEKLRPLLAQIGHCLAPDDFLVILDHDLSMKEGENDKDVHGKFTKTFSWENVVTRINSYLLRSGNTDDKRKMRLWVDLVKLSRKVQLWDICRVASCFAILYDDGRWKNHFQIKIENSSRKGNRNMGASSGMQNAETSAVETNQMSELDVTDSSINENKRRKEESDLSNNSMKQSRLEKVLLEQLTETYFIRAEAFIQALRNEGAQLLTFPERPKDLKKHPKGFIKDTSNEDKEWKSYCESLEKLSNQIVACFLRAAALSVDLQAPWFTQNAATYLWNYSMHILTLSDHGILVSSFQTMYDYLRQMINEKMVDIITNYGIVLAHGMIQKYMPIPVFLLDNIFDSPSASTNLDKKAKKDRESPKSKTVGQTGAGQNSTESVNQFKKALDICQYLMDITSDVPPFPTETTNPVPSPNTNSNNNKTAQINRTIDIKTKGQLIEIWVQCKQLLQQPVGRNLGTDDAEIKLGQRPIVRAMTSVQMVWICQNEFYKFPDLLSVNDCLQYIDLCDWEEASVLLNLLMKLAQITVKGSVSNSINTLVKITEKAVKVSPETHIGVVKRANKTNTNTGTVDAKLALSFIYFCHGLCLHKTGQNTSVLMQCLQLLVKACCYARDGNDYFLVSQISHYFWRISQVLIKRFSNTCQIAKEIEIIINCLSLTVDKKRLKLFLEPHTEEEGPRLEAELEEKLPHILQIGDDQKLITLDNNKALFLTSYRRQMSKTSLEQDLTIRIQMHIAIFQCFCFQEKWTEALKSLDEAIADLPRTNHKLDLFRHRLLTKVRLNHSIELDVQKFKNQKEEEVATLWREIAIVSNSRESQLFAYKKSIESLKKNGYSKAFVERLTKETIDRLMIGPDENNGSHSPPNDGKPIKSNVLNKSNNLLKVDLIMELSQWLFHSDYPIELCSQYIDFAINILLNTEATKEKSLSHPNSSVKNRSRNNFRKPGSGLKPNVKNENIQETPEMTNDTSNTDNNEELTNPTWFFLQEFRPRTLEDICDIRMLSKFVICLTTQAKLLGNSGGKSRDNLIMASGCVIRMWQVAMSSLTVAIKEIGKSKVEIESPTKSKDKAAKKDKSAKPNSEPVQSKTKVPKRKGPADWLPTSNEEWSVFEISDDALEAITSKVYMKSTGLHEISIPNIGQFMGACDALIEMLAEQGYELLTFPILSIMDAISRSDETVPAKLLNQYIHLRWLQFSLRINNQDAIFHHEKFINSPFVIPEYCAHVEIIKANLEEYKKQNKSQVQPMNFETQSTLPLKLSHLNRKLTKFGYIHETWIKIAWILVEIGYNQEASEVICVAEELSKMLNDENMNTECNLLKAKLMINQGEFDEALLYIDAIGSCHFTFKQWSEIIDLLIEIGTDQANEHGDISKIRLRLLRMKDHTENRVAEIKLSNQQLNSDNLIGKMNYGLLLLDRRIATLDLGRSRNWENVSEMMEAFLGKLEEIESLHESNKSFKYLIEISMEKLEIFDFLMKVNEKTNFKSLLIKKLIVIEKCLEIYQIIFDDIYRVCSPLESSAFNLPIDRKLCRAKLMLSDCLIEMFSITVEDTAEKVLQHRAKDHLTQIVDEYVEEVIPDKESKEWRIVTNGICDKICSTLSDVHTICSQIPDINAQCLLKYGHVMKLRAMELYPNKRNQWSRPLMDIEDPLETQKSKLVNLQDSSNNKEIENNSYGLLENEDTEKNYQSSIKMSKAKSQMIQNRYYLNQAVEMINQSIAISIAHEFYDCVVTATELLIDIFGQFDCQLSGQLLCLHQNSRTAAQMRNILLKTLRKASMGQLAAFVLQRDYMIRKSKREESNLTEFSLYKSVKEKLNSTFPAWKMTNVSLNPLELLKDLSYLTSGFLIFEHSLNQQFLYCAFIDTKHKTANLSKPNNKPAAIGDRTKICRIATSPSQIEDLQNYWRGFKSKLEKLVFNVENKTQIFEQRINLYSEIENQTEIQRAFLEKEALNANIQMNILEIEENYSEIMENLQEYLGPIFEKLGNFFPPGNERNSPSNQKANKETISQPGKDSIIILTDEILSVASLESIPKLKSSISRDFSLQVLHHRLKGMGESDPVDAPSTTDIKKKDKSKTPHRLAAFRDINKKSTKIIPLNRQLPTGSMAIDTNQMRFLVDPSQDSSNSNSPSLGSFFKNEMTISVLREQQITPRWVGLVGDDECPTTCELELYLKEANSMIYVNTENFISLFSPQLLLMINANDLQFLCCFDRMETRKTKERIVQKSSAMSKQDLRSQDSTSAAQLISLMGVKSFVFNQWAGLIDWNKWEIKTFFSGFLDDGMNVGECLQQIRNPPIEEVPELIKNLSLTSPSESFIKSNLVLYGLPNIAVSGSV